MADTDDDFPTIDTGNGFNANLSATTNDRLKKTVIELRDLNRGIKKLNTNLVTFTTSSDKYSKALVYGTIALVVFTVVLVVLTVVLIKDAKEQSLSEENIALNSMFFNSRDTDIISDIENSQPILVENKGKYSDANLDDYLGNFDTIQTSYDEGLLSESDLCDSFSYYISITSNDPEIQGYITQQQKTDDGFFTSLAYLMNVVSKSKDGNCH